MLGSTRTPVYALKRRINLVRVNLFSTKQAVQENVDWSEALPYNQIPTVKTFGIMKMRSKDEEKNMKYHLFFKHHFEKLNTDILKFRLPFVGDQLVIRKPDDVQAILKNDGKYPIEPMFNFFVDYRHYRKDLYPENTGLLGSHGEEWQQVRSLVQQDMMRPKSALYYVQEISQVSQEFMDLIENNVDENREISDITPYVLRWALEAVGSIFLDSRIGCLREPLVKEAKDIIKGVDICLGDTLVKLLGQPRIWKFYKTKEYKQFNAAYELMYDVTHKMVKDAQAKNQDKKYSSRDDMSVLAKLTDRCGPDSSVPHVMAMDALSAGIDTTGNTSAFILYLLATNPEAQDRAYTEIISKLPSPQEKLTTSNFNELKYPKAVMQETLRLRPVSSGFGRVTQKEMVLASYQVPPGVRIITNVTLEMRSEKFFQNGSEFIPERWMRGCPENNKFHPYVFIPFSYGPRMCIGRRFAELEMQTLIIETLRKYKLSYDGPVVDLITPWVNRPDGPIKIKFTPRK